MLVLSRRPSQQIVFPNLDIKIQILQVKGRIVKVGVEAPNEVRILRPEAMGADEDLSALTSAAEADKPDSIDRHELRNRINKISLRLYLLQKLTKMGMDASAESTLERAISDLTKLDREMGAHRAKLQASSSGRKLLVVDDDDNERELLAGLLRLHGFEVAVASDGRKALDYLANNDIPDFVLLDMKMPEIDGSETIALIRQNDRTRGVKVFAVSGASPEEYGLANGHSDIDGWFSKPLDPSQLLHAISQHAESPMTV